jgi:hypothetical protein
MSGVWENFIASGKGGERRVCSLSAYLNGYLNAVSREVRIGHEYALKALEKHGLEVQHLPLIERAIREGEVAHDRPRCLTFLYWSAEYGRWFQATVKCCSEKRALYVTTFHGLGPDDVARRRKRYVTVWPLK